MEYLILADADWAGAFMIVGVAWAIAWAIK